MCNVYNDVVWGEPDVVNDMNNVVIDVVWWKNHVVRQDISEGIMRNFTSPQQ